MEYLKPEVKERYQVSVLPCTDTEFEQVKHHIQDLELDDRELKVEEFLVLKANNELLGFGRIREFDTFSEMCSMGVLQKGRELGFGSVLVRALAKKAKQSVYLACIIPDYFHLHGFKVCEQFPVRMQDKLNYCTEHLVVPETYVVMSNA